MASDNGAWDPVLVPNVKVIRLARRKSSFLFERDLSDKWHRCETNPERMRFRSAALFQRIENSPGTLELSGSNIPVTIFSTSNLTFPYTFYFTNFDGRTSFTNFFHTEYILYIYIIYRLIEITRSQQFYAPQDKQFSHKIYKLSIDRSISTVREKRIIYDL